MPSVHVPQPRIQVWRVFCLDWEITLELTNTLILHLTFGYHQVEINRPILDSLETVWDGAVSLHSSYVSKAESSRARSFHWDDVPIIGGHTQPCLYGSVRGPVDLAAACLLQTCVLFLLLRPLTFYLKGLACVCVDRVWGGVVTKAVVPLESL